MLLVIKEGRDRRRKRLERLASNPRCLCGRVSIRYAAGNHYCRSCVKGIDK